MKATFSIEGHKSKGTGRHLKAAFNDAVSDLLHDGHLTVDGKIIDWSVWGREGDGFEYRAYMDDGSDQYFRGHLIKSE